MLAKHRQNRRGLVVPKANQTPSHVKIDVLQKIEAVLLFVLFQTFNGCLTVKEVPKKAVLV